LSRQTGYLTVVDEYALCNHVGQAAAGSPPVRRRHWHQRERITGSNARHGLIGQYGQVELYTGRG